MPRVLSTEAEFDASIAAPTVTLVEFTGPNCIICKRLEPMIDTAARRAPDVDVVQVDASHLIKAAERYAIRSVPTLILFRDGKPLDRKAGFATAAELVRWFDARRAAPVEEAAP
jgi:thioredoxin-like negative regulator of GroEL